MKRGGKKGEQERKLKRKEWKDEERCRGRKFNGK